MLNKYDALKGKIVKYFDWVAENITNQPVKLNLINMKYVYFFVFW